MIVSQMSAWTVLRTTSGDFWLVGDLNARFCAPAVISKSSSGVSLTTQSSCDAGAASADCTSDDALKGFGL